MTQFNCEGRHALQTSLSDRIISLNDDSVIVLESDEALGTFFDDIDAEVDSEKANPRVTMRDANPNKPSAVEASAIWKGVVLGTPRTYGNRKSEDIWRSAIKNGRWQGEFAKATLQIPVHLDFEFRVNPESRFYNRNVSTNGPDLDTMVIGALGGLLHCRNPERPTLRLIQHGGLCRAITASKTLVGSDDQTGFTLNVRSGEVIPFEDPSNDTGLSFGVNRQNLKSHRRRAVQQAAEQANESQFRAPRGTRVEIRLAFAEGLTRNPLSADWLEAVIDGLGASRAGSERFFDGPATQVFGYDDSVVFKLLCAQVQGLPPEIGLHISCALLTN